MNKIRAQIMNRNERQKDKYTDGLRRSAKRKYEKILKKFESKGENTYSQRQGERESERRIQYPKIYSC